MKKIYIFTTLIIVATLTGSSLWAQEAAESKEATSWSEALTDGKATLNMRLRYENGQQDGLEDSDAFTIRTRLGYGTKSIYGLKAFVEFEDVSAIGDGNDYNQAGINPGGAGKTVIADVEGTELNQAFLEYRCPSGSQTILGRQRIILDNARFVGNVGWRQNEQTYDAVTVKTPTMNGFHLYYSYIDSVRRIFGQENGTQPPGAAGNAAEYDSDSHIVRAKMELCDHATATAYGYLLDLGDAVVGAANSSDTYGLSLNSNFETDSGIKFAGDFEYASQSDNSATIVGVNYRADYYKVDINGNFKIAIGGIGYEVLGSDNGASFRTPLATGHKFNGWADLFLVTPAEGLRDTYVYVGATCPLSGAKLKAIYHNFESDVDSIDYGSEIDLLIAKTFCKNLTAIGKFSDYSADSGDNNPRPDDVQRFSIEMNIAF